MTQRHSNLVAWQRADDLFVEVHRPTKSFPADERFELGSQIRRAAYSVPANIVEGFARLGYIDAATYETIDTHARQTAAPWSA